MEKEWFTQRLDTLRAERGWSKCALNEEAGFADGMIYQWYNTERMPTVQNIEMICKACNITLSQFFADNLNEAELFFDMEFNKLYLQLTLEEKIFIREIVKNFIQLKKTNGYFNE